MQATHLLLQSLYLSLKAIKRALRMDNRLTQSKLCFYPARQRSTRIAQKAGQNQSYYNLSMKKAKHAKT